MLLVIDNYDSFTYNLVQYLGELGETVEVRRNDRVTLQAYRVRAAAGANRDFAGSGHCLIRRASRCRSSNSLQGRFRCLVFVLAIRAIGQAFGGRVIRAPELMHGKASEVHHDGKTIFRGFGRAVSSPRAGIIR
jgi:anthranilate/para-aminobenzoate synthase component II